MNTKLNFLKHAIMRIENNDEYMAHTLKKYQEFEQLPESELLQLLGCSLNDYYKLALCKTVDMGAPDFTKRITKISEYVNIETSKLIMVIKRVNNLVILKSTSGKILMAARDKEDKNRKK